MKLRRYTRAQVLHYLEGKRLVGDTDVVRMMNVALDLAISGLKERDYGIADVTKMKRGDK